MEALGYVECNGLSSATVAADRMLKTSDVKLSRIRNADNGWITLEFTGDIAALKVAVETVKQTLSESYVAGLVIGSPTDGLDQLGSSGATDVDPQNFNPEKYNLDGTMKRSAMFGPRPDSEEQQTSVAKTSVDVEKQLEEKSVENVSDDQVTCNLCGDPNCPRKLGEPHNKCIHYND
ncbi:MAG: BMC domain-containing protein [Levilactobacillus sp.]|jgi:microcompartment protein CcmL/EutN|uniref:BMC domain-containing protein n=1 Tax=Levilactobacillus sp. TaxID=2767919 RepID=UPI0025897140|nr:BMC domain-containing protein [Levilactobacillus sp.]MCI1553206.1 BMC domain-containing protein [Levilactobacillus sp.]